VLQDGAKGVPGHATLTNGKHKVAALDRPLQLRMIYIGH
jgi:hypothetical protein